MTEVLANQEESKQTHLSIAAGRYADLKMLRRQIQVWLFTLKSNDTVWALALMRSNIVTLNVALSLPIFKSLPWSPSVCNQRVQWISAWLYGRMVFADMKLQQPFVIFLYRTFMRYFQGLSLQEIFIIMFCCRIIYVSYSCTASQPTTYLN